MGLKCVATMEEWTEKRQALLVEEKKLSKQIDVLRNAQRALPMVKVEKSYTFKNTEGADCKLQDLFRNGNTHLFVYHMMYQEDWSKPCSICQGWVDSFYSNVLHLENSDVSVAVIAKASHAKVQTQLK